MAADQSSDKEVLEAESLGSASDLNRSDLDPIYIGGLPASRPIRRQVSSRSYVGCMKNVEIARSNFDLLREAYGVKKGCIVEAVRSVSVLRGGFAQLPPISLSRQGSLLFSFSTRNHSGVLLAAFNKDPARARKQDYQSFLVVQLVSGRIEAEMRLLDGTNHRVGVEPRSSLLSDGAEHSVIVSINASTLSLHVDEDHIDSTPHSSARVVPLSLSSVFIGGIPAEEASRLPMRIKNNARSFRGCIQNLAVNRELLDLSGSLRYEGVELDSCLLEERDSGAVLPDDQEVEPTSDPAHTAVTPPTELRPPTPGTQTCVSESEPTFLPSASQFGLAKHSHMTFTFNANTVRKSFTVKLSVRTHAENGLLFFMANANQMDYAILQVVGGKLVFSVDLGKGPSSASFAHPINDGKWHKVRTELSKHSVSLWLDGASSGPQPVRGNQLDVEYVFYLGGRPHTLAARKAANVSSSLPGCLQAVSLNSVKLNLSRPASQHNTASCFTNTQPGSYFNGSGHAAFLRDGYKVGSDMSISLEFRTDQSEAVLLGISSAKVDAIGLEIINRQVVFNINNGAGRVAVVCVGVRVCDGRWHQLTAMKSKHTLSVTVDGQTNTVPNPYPQSTSAETNNPVYLGGFPDKVKQNSLSTSSAFRGCMRNMKLVKGHMTEVLQLSSAFFLSGVTPNTCPTA